MYSIRFSTSAFLAEPLLPRLEWRFKSQPALEFGALSVLLWSLLSGMGVRVLWAFWFFFFSFCGWSAMLKPSVHMLPGIEWCSAGLLPFPTACWWLTHSAAITGVSVAARWKCLGECSWPSVPLLCNCRVQSPWCQFASGALVGYSVLFAT